MLRHRTLFWGGLLVVAASVYAAVVYREAIAGATFGLPVLVIVAITGTVTASAIFFYQRLEGFTGSFQSSETERVAAKHALRASEQRLVAENKALTELTARQARGSVQFENVLRDLLETAAHTLDVARVSMWSFVMNRSAIECLDLYEQRNGHVTGQVLLSADFPAYFEALENERLIAAADAHRDPRTAQFSDDRVLFYTDGITEREDNSGNMYEIDRLMDTFHALRAASAQELIDALVADGARFAGGREPADDQTLLLMTVRE